MVDVPHPDRRVLVQLVSADLHATTPGQQLEPVVVRRDLRRCPLGGAPPRPEELRRDGSRVALGRRDRDPIGARGLLAQRVAGHGAQPPDTAEQLVRVPVRIRQAKVAAMRAHAAALRPCRDLRNSTAEQPSNRGLKRFQYPVVVRGSSPVEIEANDSKVLEVLTPESEHWRGLQLDPNHRLLIRRSLVRAQVGEPIKSKGYVARRNPFLFAILDSGSASCASSLSPIATPRPSSLPASVARTP